MVDIETLVSAYRVCTEYISTKDRQTLADHLVAELSEAAISEEDLRFFGHTDSYLRRAVEEYFGEEDDDYDSDVDDYE
jgi:hypothetical protein